MRTALIVFTAGIAAMVSVPLSAQNRAPAQSQGGTCYIELQKLMSDTNGVGELSAAVRDLNTRLRPQIEEVGRLKRLVETLQEQQEVAMRDAPVTDGDISRSVRTVATPVALAEQAREPRELAHLTMDLRRTNAELQSKQMELRAAYSEQMRAIVGPVQTRIGERAQTFGSQRGCSGLKMARMPEVAGLQSSGARNITGDFISWYAVNKS
jgi:hypothetical protein